MNQKGAVMKILTRIEFKTMIGLEILPHPLPERIDVANLTEDQLSVFVMNCLDHPDHDAAVESFNSLSDPPETGTELILWELEDTPE